MISKNEIFEAVARGWCSPKTEHLVMDPTLGEAVAVEVIKLLQERGVIEQDRHSAEATQEIYVHVRLADAERTLVWRTVRAANIKDGIKMAQAMQDVESVLEGSNIPGGVLT